MGITKKLFLIHFCLGIIKGLDSFIFEGRISSSHTRGESFFELLIGQTINNGIKETLTRRKEVLQVVHPFRRFCIEEISAHMIVEIKNPTKQKYKQQKA